MSQHHLVLCFSALLVLIIALLLDRMPFSKKISPALSAKISIIRERVNKSDWDDDDDNISALPPFVVDVAEKVLENLVFEQEPNVTPSYTGEVDITWSPWDRNSLDHLPEGILAVSIDEEEFDFSTGFKPTEIVEWTHPKDVEKCALQVVNVIQPLIDST